MRKYEKPEAELIKFAAMEAIADNSSAGVGGSGDAESNTFDEDDFE